MTYKLNTIFVEDVLVNGHPQWNEYFIQHEIIKLPNGNYISLGPDYRYLPVSQKDNISTGNWPWEINDPPQFSDSELASYPWMGDRLIEWDPITKDPLWTISSFDIYNSDDFDILYGIWGDTPALLPFFDWTHINAISYNEVQNAIYISSRHLSKITKINYETREIVWTMGWNQADLYNIENTFSDFQLKYPDGSDASFSFQHGLQILDNGNIVTLDNGNLSKFTWIPPGESLVNKSRIIEISVDEDNNSAEVVWEYILPDSLYGRLSGNAQKLYNGNYFVTVIADEGTSLEITPSKQVVWECKYNLGSSEGPLYRAHKLTEIPRIDCPVDIDECGVCGGNNSPNTGICDCTGTPGNLMEDCNGDCGGGDLDCYLSNDFIWPNRINILNTYPNPFNPLINIEYSNDRVEYISIKVYNLKGENIDTLVESYVSVGKHKVTWNGTGHPTGIYFIRLSSISEIITQKIMLLK